MAANRLEYSAEIKAENSKIWEALWDDESYRKWAGIFFEGSYLTTESWEEGSTIRFLAPDQSGIYSKIEKHILNEYIQFRHVGNVLKGEEQELDEETKAWTGAHESYKLIGSSDRNTLLIEIDVLDEHLDFMKEKLPLALEKVKELAEGN
jgi:hypothetical protein